VAGHHVLHDVLDLLNGSIINHLFVKKKYSDTPATPLSFKQRQMSQNAAIFAAADRNVNVLELIKNKADPFSRSV
jgi:hypothetical protein